MLGANVPVSADLVGSRGRSCRRTCIGRFSAQGTVGTVDLLSDRSALDVGRYMYEGRGHRALHSLLGESEGKGVEIASKQASERWGFFGAHSLVTRSAGIAKFGIRGASRVFGWPVSVGAACGLRPQAAALGQLPQSLSDDRRPVSPLGQA